MSSPKVVSRVHRSDLNAASETPHIRHGRRDLSPFPPSPAESISETRRVFLKRKYNEHPEDNSALRGTQELLHTENNRNYNNSPPAIKRPKSSVIVVSKPLVNRSNICPVLIRVFYTTDGRHAPVSSFLDGKYPPNEVQLNTWMNVSLKELSQDIIYAVKLRSLDGRRQSQLKMSQPIRLHFSSVFPDNGSRGKYRKRDLGFCIISGFDYSEKKAKISPDDGSATLESKKFQIGDLLDVAISNIGERRAEEVMRFRRGLDRDGRF